jgi:DNA-binding CsgD family transcriptional regulator
MVELCAGESPSAVEKLERAVAGFRRSGPATLTWYLGMLALAYLAAARTDLAAPIVAETDALVADLPRRALPRGAALGQLGVAYLGLGDRAAQRRILADLEPFAGQHHWVLIDRVRGDLAAALGESSLAERAYAAAAQAAIRGGLAPELALTEASRARMRIASGNAPARAELDAAVMRLRGLGMHRDAGRFAGGSARSLPAGLSAREAEVLALVARGLTNRQIGEELGISEKTVTNHLTHIFTKCNLENRAAAVAFALRHQLA